MVFFVSIFFYLFFLLSSPKTFPLTDKQAAVFPPSETKQLLAENTNTNPINTNAINAFDPFADYSEFENTEEEMEDIYFFQNSRFLTLGIKGGLKLFTLNMAQLYMPGPVYSIYLNYFFDTQFSFQFETTLSTHRVVLQSEVGSLWGNGDFFSMGVAFRYFINTLLFTKRFQWFQPYFILGVFHSSVTVAATLTEQAGTARDTGFGLDMGAGIEFLIARKLHLGIQYSFQFITLQKEALPLTFNTGTGISDSEFRPYGDWMHISALLGVNF